MKHRELRYSIDYLTADGTKRGQEPCTVTVHTDGQRTIRARSEIFDTEIVRDVTYTVGADFRPIDCFIRVRQWDKVIGSTWFRFAGKTAECEGFTTNEGRISQRFDLEKPPESFITHAVSTDVWHCTNIKKDPALGRQLIDPIPSCSPLANGASGPMLGQWPMTAEYVGIETIEVPAGKFEAEHVRYVELDGSLWLEMWCTNDPDRVRLKMYDPVYETSYVLASLERD
ncbi:MAG: hypothetical protein VW362_08025 [Candidatus Nanopelagicales bacterium]